MDTNLSNAISTYINLSNSWLIEAINPLVPGAH